MIPADLAPRHEEGLVDAHAHGDIDLTVVIPLLDEVDNIDPLIARLVPALDRLGRTWEVIFVDDGSQDGSLAKLESAYRRDARLAVLSLSRNFGQTQALMAGFDHAHGNIVVTLDADLQNDPDDISSLIMLLESNGYSIVSGRRRRRQDHHTRRLQSIAGNLLMRSLFGIRIHDTGCSLKAYRGDVLRTTRLFGGLHRFVPVALGADGRDIGEVDVHHYPRKAGASKYGYGFRRVGVVFSDLTTLFLATNRTNRYVQGLIWLASVRSLIYSIAINAVTWLFQASSGVTVPNVIMITLGIIGIVQVVGLGCNIALSRFDHAQIGRGYTIAQIYSASYSSQPALQSCSPPDVGLC